MDVQLTEVEARVLGCLIEKEQSTPEYYPLTLNALTAACNQKSNRNPVMSLRDKDVARALDQLRTKHLASEAYLAGSRVPKYEHQIRRQWGLPPPEVAVLCALLLRGPQTPGEIRSRSGRLHAFSDLEAVGQALQQLISHENGPFVVELERLAGRRENRFMHLFCGLPSLEALQPTVRPETATLEMRAENDRIAALEGAVQSLQSGLDDLRARFELFKKQFE